MIRGFISLVLLVGCTAAEEPVLCSQVCEFYQGTCNPETHVYVAHTQYDDGKGCWMKTAACYPRDTPSECVPADCYFEQSLACDQQK